MVLLPSKMVLPPSKMVLPPSKMVLPQAMAWVQYLFRVLSLKFCGKSKKICGDISQVSPAFCMYGVKWCVYPTHKVSNLETHQQRMCHRKQIKLNGMAFFPPPPPPSTACFLCQANPLYSALAAIYSRRQGQGRPGVPVVISREKWDR